MHTTEKEINIFIKKIFESKKSHHNNLRLPEDNEDNITSKTNLYKHKLCVKPLMHLTPDAHVCSGIPTAHAQGNCYN